MPPFNYSASSGGGDGERRVYRFTMSPKMEPTTPAPTTTISPGASAVPAVGDLDITALQLAPRFSLVDVAAIGPDMRSRWQRRV